MTVRFLELYGSISLQSLPSPGRRHYGVPPGGAFDVVSHTFANALLGNEAGCACLELSAAAGRMSVLHGGSIAWVGAGAAQKVMNFEAGEVFDLPYPNRGCRSYLAMPGGISTDDDGTFRSVSGGTLESRKLGESPAEELFVRVIRSPHCSNERWSALLSQTFRVDPNSNRLGVRLTSNDPASHSEEKPSEPMDVGVIQLPPSGNPIILGPDGPTIGGYPTLGSVARVDLRICAQLRPGSEIKFLEIGREEAKRAWETDQEAIRKRSLLLRLSAVAAN